MVDEREYIEMVPSAKRMIGSMRDLGYDFVKAVADIVDNSIEANATEIKITMEFKGDHSWVLIADNGKGMTADELNEGMRFGTEREYTGNELGKFGLGMKTAPISQCRKLTVASKSAAPESDIVIRQLNLERIEETNRWEITSIPKEDYSEILWKSLEEHSGTVIMWENLDRMLQYDPPDGMRAEKGFLNLARELEQHLGMVFNRFISGELGENKKLSVTLNGNVVKAWDPFARDERATVALEKKSLAAFGTGGVFMVMYSPFILPPKEKFSSSAAFNRMAGPAGWNDQQGFYIYRENRLIQSGGWCRMRLKDEHIKLARIALDLHSDSDSSLGLNIMKSNINLPRDLKDKLSPMVKEVVKLALKVYTPEKKTDGHRNPSGDAGQKPVSGTDSSTGVFVSRNTYGNHASGTETSNASPPHAVTVVEKTTGLAGALEKAARMVGELEALHKIRNALKAEDPDSATRIGW